MVWKLDRLGRSLQDLMQIVNDLAGRGVGFHHCPETLGVGQVSTWCIAVPGRLRLVMLSNFTSFEWLHTGVKRNVVVCHCV